MEPLSRSFVPHREILLARKRMNDCIRSFFDGRGFLEVETPVAVRSPGLEPHLEAFETDEIGPDTRIEHLYLHTSPEYAMKKMVGAGIGSIYQLARVFRNGERSRTHTPEFTMLEWYRSPGTIGELMYDTERLIAGVAKSVGGPWTPKKFERLSISEAFVRAGLSDPLLHDRPEALKSEWSIRTQPDDSYEDIFFRGFFERVEPSLDPDTVTILHGYPASMAALAKIDPEDPKRALRFEVFVGSLELANAFGELTDAKEQRARFETELIERRQSGKPEYPIDEDLLEALPKMGPCAGIALGVDRLLMKCLGANAIQDVIPFAPRD